MERFKQVRSDSRLRLRWPVRERRAPAETRSPWLYVVPESTVDSGESGAAREAAIRFASRHPVNYGSRIFAPCSLGSVTMLRPV